MVIVICISLFDYELEKNKKCGMQKKEETRKAPLLTPSPI